MTSSNPLTRFAGWLDDARQQEHVNPDAACLATVTAEGRPAARMVLVRGVDRRGLVFYTNLQSRKAAELGGTPHAALCFYWRSLDRQARIEGAVEAVSDDDADAYFASRPRASQIGAWASRQSRRLASRAELEARLAEHEARFAEAAVPRPAFWSGYRVVAERIEFWTQGVDRLHDRLVYECTDDGGWASHQLYP